VTYFHNVFTLPHELNPLLFTNKRILMDSLFKAVSDTLLTFGRNPKNGLGGKLGFIAVLHTWDQKMLDHVHLHCLIPAGALSLDGTDWIHADLAFLFPVYALSKVFKGKYIALLRQAYKQKKLIFPGKTEAYASQQDFEALIDSVAAKKWVVYSKPPFGSPKQVLDYLGRYTHRVAISNNRIIKVEKGYVTFTYRHRADNDCIKEITITTVEFMRRFLHHVLPKDFMKIRYYGFLANRCKKQDLKRCRQLLHGQALQEAPTRKSTVELMLELTGRDITLCPNCHKGTMLAIKELQPLATKGYGAYSNRSPPKGEDTS
jgi:hypothetical protein